jgi:hypothetical protein
VRTTLPEPAKAPWRAKHRPRRQPPKPITPVIGAALLAAARLREGRAARPAKGPPLPARAAALLAKGIGTQFHGTDGRSICDVVIGLDFGTSCSKVILRTPYHFQGKTFAPGLARDLGLASPLYWPTVVWVDPQGTFAPVEIPGGLALRDIKTRFFDQPQGLVAPESDERAAVTAADAVTAYLALILRHVRGWFLEEKATAYGRLKLRWHVNLGLPAANYDDARRCEEYDRICRAAWAVSRVEGPITLNGVRHVLNASNSPRDVTLGVVPEVAAEAAGYARSLRRELGLHLLIDVGAGTLDVCGFVLQEKDDEHRYDILTADVQALGIGQLQEFRLRAIVEAYQSQVRAKHAIEDPEVRVPETIAPYVDDMRAFSQDLSDVDARFAVACETMLRRSLLFLRRTRDPNSPKWHKGIPVLLCGGGGASPVYQAVVRNLEAWLVKLIGGGRLVQKTVPRPTGLEGDIPDGQFHRLAVAWGLSYPRHEIGDIVPPSDIDDVGPPSLSDYSHLYPAKEHT